MTETRIRGKPASPGFASGPVFVLPVSSAAGRAASGDPATEAAALRAAIGSALDSLASLASCLSGEAADMLGFQVAMLSDDELAKPAFAAIAAGHAADTAWRAAMDREIAGYATADDEYFRARAADLQDIRERVIAHLLPEQEAQSVPPGAVVVTDELPLTNFLSIDWREGGAILLTQGSPTSHVAMLARSRGVPMVVGLGGTASAFADRAAIVDAIAGEVVLNPEPVTLAEFTARQRTEAQLAAVAAQLLNRPAMTADGIVIATHLNIAGPDELATLDPSICDGIGLVRTEFLFQRHRSPPAEDAQFDVYRTIVEWARGRPVTFRTLDAGGDKPIPGVTVDGESNPFLGTRGIRLSLLHADMFRAQLRALLRAAAHGTLRIMLPMVTVPQELAAARQMLREEKARLGGIAVLPPLGIMIEVPAAAIAVDHFDADFFSIGSNDLTQYVTAAGRDIGAVAELADPLNPAVLRLVENVVSFGRKSGKDVSLCGDAGGDPAAVPTLLGTGLRCLSMSPSDLARVKQAIAAVDLCGPAS